MNAPIEHIWVGDGCWVRHGDGTPLPDPSPDDQFFLLGEDDVLRVRRWVLDHVARLYEERDAESLSLERRVANLEHLIVSLPERDVPPDYCPETQESCELDCVVYCDRHRAGSVNEVAETPGDAQEGDGSNPARSEGLPQIPVRQIVEHSHDWQLRFGTSLRMVDLVVPGESEFSWDSIEVWGDVSQVEVRKADVLNGARLISEGYNSLDIAEEVRKAGYKP